MLNGINEEGLSNDRYKVNTKNYSGTTTEDICDSIKPEVRKKTGYNYSLSRNKWRHKQHQIIWKL